MYIYIYIYICIIIAEHCLRYMLYAYYTWMYACLLHVSHLPSYSPKYFVIGFCF